MCTYEHIWSSCLDGVFPREQGVLGRSRSSFDLVLQLQQFPSAARIMGQDPE